MGDCEQKNGIMRLKFLRDLSVSDRAEPGKLFIGIFKVLWTTLCSHYSAWPLYHESDPGIVMSIAGSLNTETGGDSDVPCVQWSTGPCTDWDEPGPQAG